MFQTSLSSCQHQDLQTAFPVTSDDYGMKLPSERYQSFLFLHKKFYALGCSTEGRKSYFALLRHTLVNNVSQILNTQNKAKINFSLE